MCHLIHLHYQEIHRTVFNFDFVIFFFMLHHYNCILCRGSSLCVVHHSCCTLYAFIWPVWISLSNPITCVVRKHDLAVCCACDLLPCFKSHGRPSLHIVDLFGNKNVLLRKSCTGLIHLSLRNFLYFLDLLNISFTFNIQCIYLSSRPSC